MVNMLFEKWSNANLILEKYKHFDFTQVKKHSKNSKTDLSISTNKNAVFAVRYVNREFVYFFVNKSN